MTKVAGTREDVVREALSWEGTRYMHCQRVKILRGPDGSVLDPGGVDCGQFIYMVFRACELTPELPLKTYSPQEWIHNSNNEFLRIVLGRGHETKNPRPGDVVMYRPLMAGSFGHGAIVIDPGWPHIIHAHMAAGRVITDFGDSGQMTRKPRKFFTAWDD